MILKVISRMPQPILVVAAVLIALKLIVAKKDRLKKYLPRITIANAQSKGKRKRQEDSFATIVDENKVLAVIADGMGGLHSGKEASELVTKNFMEQFCRKYNIDSVNQFLINTLHDSNQELLARSRPEKIGTTLVAAVLDENLLYWVAVGDSHLYLYRDKKLLQLNTDHVFANKLKTSYRAGEISRYQMLNHPQKDRLTSYLGINNLSELDYSVNPVEIKKKDKIVLCTDGIYNSLSRTELIKILGQEKNLQEIAEEIIDKVTAKEQPNQDNATIVVLEKN
ncbi:MAG: PP2C family protein-serine/threonine phosphatase [Bacillota bacterium]